MPAIMMMPDSGVARQRDRQQQRHRRDRTDAGQHADQRADEDADEAEKQVDRAKRDAEAMREVGEQITPLRPLTAAGSVGCSGSGRPSAYGNRRLQPGREGDADDRWSGASASPGCRARRSGSSAKAAMTRPSGRMVAANDRIASADEQRPAPVRSWARRLRRRLSTALTAQCGRQAEPRQQHGEDARGGARAERKAVHALQVARCP